MEVELPRPAALRPSAPATTPAAGIEALRREVVDIKARMRAQYTRTVQVESLDSDSDEDADDDGPDEVGDPPSSLAALPYPLVRLTLLMMEVLVSTRSVPPMRPFYLAITATNLWVLFSLTRSSVGALSLRGEILLGPRSSAMGSFPIHLLISIFVWTLRVSFRRRTMSCLGSAALTAPICPSRRPPLRLFLFFRRLVLVLLFLDATALYVRSFCLLDNFVV